MKKTILVIMVVIIGLSANAMQTFADDALKGLDSMVVIVESLGPEGVKVGITEKEIQTFVELKLRQNGIKVNERNEGKPPEFPYLYVNINIGNWETPFAVFSASIQLNQYVKLLRNNNIVVARVWDQGVIAKSSWNETNSFIKEVVDGIMTSFLNEYLKANPK